MVLECYAGVLSWYLKLSMRELDLCNELSDETHQILDNLLEIGKDIIRRWYAYEPGNDNNLNLNTQKSN